jgi:lipopolysaccharide export system protein LptA
MIPVLKRTALLFMVTVVSVFSQTSPLIMKHADNLEVARTRGNLLLQGKVHFVHDSLDFRTEKATWSKEAEVLQCEGGFLAAHPSGYIRAQTGVYQKKQGIASAKGNVVAADSQKTYMFTGDYLVYDREKEILTMPDKPKLFEFEKKKDGKIDTVVIEAKKIIYNKGASYAEAFQNVKVTQDDMVVTCDTGFFDRKNNWLSMKGNPTFDMKTYHLTGDSIFLELDSAGKSLKSALVIRNAHGIQREEAKRNAPGSVTEAFGDTLYAAFSDNKIERLYVNLNARGFFFETDLPDYQNQMDGTRLDMYFNQGKMDRAVVSGKAQSTYFYVKKDRSVAGKNEAAGDTINILFDAQKNAVKSLKLLGRSTLATGRYIDMEKEQRNKKKLLAESDSTKTTPRETVKEAPKGSAQEKLMNEDSKRGKLFRQAIEAKKAEMRTKKEDAK